MVYLLMRFKVFLIVFSLLKGVLPAQDSTLVKEKRFRLNIYSALVGNNSFSNSGFDKLHPQSLTETVYSKDGSMPVCLGYAGGIEGRIKGKGIISFVFGINYELTNSVLIEDKAYYIRMGYGFYEGDTTHIHYKRQVQMLGANFGVQFAVTQKLAVTVYPGTQQNSLPARYHEGIRKYVPFGFYVWHP